MTSVASEAFALLNRPSASSRTAAPKSGQDDGGFAAMMESHADVHEAAKSSRTERHDRASSRRTERAAPADKPAATEAAPRDEAPSKADDTPSADAPAENPAVKASDAAETADDAAGEPNAHKDETAVVTGVVPADPAQTAIPVIAVVTAPVATAPVEAVVPTEAAPVSTAPATPPATPAGDTATAAPATTAPEQQASADTDGQTAAPAVTAAAPAVTPETTAADQTTPATVTPQIKAQTTKEKSDKTTTGETAENGETGLEAATSETPDDDAKQTKHPATHTSTTQAQAHVEKPGVKPEHGLKPDDLLPAPKLTADTMTQAMPQMPAHAMAATATGTQSSPVNNGQTVPLNAIAVEIAGQAKAGNSRFEIRLDPPELGRIDVRLDVDKDGNVSSRLVIERADTYDLLRRDQSTLERALQQAGLKTSDNALEFSLRDQGFAQQQRQDQENSRGIRTLVAESDVMPSEAASGYARLLGGRSGVDIRV